MGPTVAEVRRMLQTADAARFAVLERALAADERKGVRDAVEVARRRLDAEAAEAARVGALYDFEEGLPFARDGVWVGLDEVGRGSLAGPVAAGAVVLARSPRIMGLDDSKKLSRARRSELAATIKEHALAWAVSYVEPHAIDERGMTAALKCAFSSALEKIEDAGFTVSAALLDGNPLHFDAREVNIVKGDARCASIAAASIVAKVERDALMSRLAVHYPDYHLEACKGYASAEHIAAIRAHGLTPIHRATFCTAFTQASLF